MRPSSKTNHTQRPGKEGRRGVALILALLFVVLLTAIVVEFTYEAEVDASFASNQGADLEAYLAAKSAVALGIADLKRHLLNLLTDDLDDRTPFAGQQYDTRFDRWAIGHQFEPLNEATMRTTIDDEFGKINLNALVDHSRGQPRENQFLVQAVRALFAMRSEEADTDVIVDSLLDWLDYNDEDSERPNGAENEYYMGLENPYSCKNGPMDSVEELLLIKGITPTLYFGDPEAEPPQAPLSEYLTVHGDWTGRVNVNTAREDTLFALEEGYGGAFSAAAILDDRYQNGGFNRIEQVDQYVDRSLFNRENRQRDQDGDDNTDGGNNPDPDPNPNPDRNVGDDGLGAKQNRPGRTQRQQQQQRRGQQRQNQNQNAGPDIFTIHSNTFRVYGDGQHGDVKVRIEAYVWRVPMDAQQTLRLPPIAQNQFALPVENFRILEWKVIR